MKRLAALVFPVIFSALSCKHEHYPIVGGGFDVNCICVKDSTLHYYSLGNKYVPFDSNNVYNPCYTDSCSALKKATGADSSYIAVITL